MNKTNSILNIQWKPVIWNGVMSAYWISDHGDLWSTKTNQFIKWQPDRHGYLRTIITIEDTSVYVMAHRLVAQAFIPNPENKPQVNHKDGNKANNCVGNLEWVTNLENARHAMRMGIMQSNYTEDQIKQVCEMLEKQCRPIDIEAATGVSRVTIYYIRIGKQWTDVSSRYNIPPMNFIDGENNVNNKFTEDQIHQVCKMLEDASVRYTDIETSTGVSKDTISNIRAGKVWRQISSMYDIHRVDRAGEDHGCAVYTNDQIRKVCDMLMDPYLSMTEISQATGVEHVVVHHVATGKTWRSISSEYKIPQRIERKTEIILDLDAQGYSAPEITTIIMEEFNLTNRRRVNQSVGDILRRNKRKLSSSSTIDQL